MTAFARSERRQLADLLLRLGPDEPTLCAGWTTRDLAAHLVVRERRPDSALGMLIPPLRGRSERIRLAKAAEPFDRVVEQVRRPPWWSPVSNPLTDELANAGEFFIHHEDVRRAATGWEPRTLTADQSVVLWRQAVFAGKMALRRARLPVRVVESGGLGEFTVGEKPQVTLSGPAGELALFLSGRQASARVDVDGPDDSLRNARLGL
ncbi:TIGR03085 family metal-binding protein [Paractinoplanes ferrugineus]|uniref:TIGR03085 family protein n=1 Tax=Paractinoplanes ferrugineus TaxID=113564 RepID=A0A919J3U0_9ACTN|nr:TIGR03085 family metal-binding protein [Actinoplanes ferrugineus]GIE14291.1 TIGR03085 family protein [Actinoplanes ferrugineus]